MLATLGLSHVGVRLRLVLVSSAIVGSRFDLLRLPSSIIRPSIIIIINLCLN